MANYTLVTFLVVMMTINVGLGLFDSSIRSYNSDFDDKNFNFNFSSSPASRLTNSQDLSSGVISNDTSAVFFDTADSVNPETGETFTDTYKTTNKFLLFLQGSWSLVSSILTQPAGFMLSAGVPVAYAVGFQAIWYVITILLLIGFRKGGT